MTVVGTKNIWRLNGGSGASTVDFQFQVIGDVEPTAGAIGQRMVDPCTGKITLIMRGDPGVMPPFEWNLQLRIPQAADRNTIISAIRTAWRYSGPYTLTLPNGAGTRTVIVDNSQDLRERWGRRGERVVPLRLLEQS